MGSTRLGDRFRAAMRRFPALRAIVRSRPVQRTIMTWREARCVGEPVRFARRQLTSSATARYRLRESGLTVVIRHRTRDADILREIFGGGAGGHCYEPPPEVARLLDHGRPLRILDLGGNIGLFGAWVFGRWPGAHATSFEPDPANGRLLSDTIAVNGLGGRWEQVYAAVATSTGRARFAAGEFADSRLTDDAGGSAIDVPTIDLFQLDHGVDLLKVDIEGGEWPILTDPRMAGLRARVLLLEWHGSQSAEPDAREAVHRLLRGAGYTRIEDAGRDPDTDVGVLWAWRPGGS